MGADGDRITLESRVCVPDHVVLRDFGDEAVILNLDTGLYHGLNQTAAVMIERLREGDSVGAALDRLCAEFDQPREVVERDLLDLAEALAERGLIEPDGRG